MRSQEHGKDAWDHLRKGLTGVDASLGNFGKNWRKMLHQVSSRFELEALTVWRRLNSPFNYWYDSVSYTEFVPLHYGEMSVEDVKDLSKHHELEKLADTTAYWSVQKENARRLDTVQAWLFCLLTALTFMHLGRVNENIVEPELDGDHSPTQGKSLAWLYLTLDHVVTPAEEGRHLRACNDWSQGEKSQRSRRCTVLRN